MADSLDRVQSSIIPFPADAIYGAKVAGTLIFSASRNTKRAITPQTTSFDLIILISSQTFLLAPTLFLNQRHYQSIMSVEIQQLVKMDVENVYSSNSTNNNNDTSEGADSSKPEASLSSQAADSTDVFNPQLLQMYYSRLFPYNLMHTWLSYGGSDPSIFTRREFSFTLDVGGDEIYLRYQSFQGAEDLQQAILNRRPAKIDIGAVFSHVPSQKNTLPESRFLPVQREFVLDVDLTDYDDVRTCGCTGAKICGKCWKFMNMAVKVMDEGLRQDFGFQHIAWFYSGRRGVHAWVCDESARMLSDEGRSAVATYFEVSFQLGQRLFQTVYVFGVDQPHHLCFSHYLSSKRWTSDQTATRT